MSGGAALAVASGLFADPAQILHGHGLDVLLSDYDAARQAVEQLAELAARPAGAFAAWRYYACLRNDRGYIPSDPKDFFDAAAAVRALDADYWQRALELTDVRDYMPSRIRDEWDDQIRGRKCPPFERATVLESLSTLLSARADYLAQMVDGIFRGLSGEHVTNRPEGFGRRMIIAHAYNEYGHGTRAMDLIHDLRCVCAKFLGRDIPPLGSTRRILEGVRRTPGDWRDVDAGVLRVRAYLKGTAHMEVHPDLAWRLNAVLAHLHPMAIPASHRTRPAKPRRDWVLFDRPLPAAVMHELCGLRVAYGNPCLVERGYHDADKSVWREVVRVMQSLGGVWAGTGWCFDYDVREAFDAVVASGCLPDDRAHQYYPTPPDMAAEAVALAKIGSDHTVLEPSAGNGAIADLLPPDRTLCVEAADLRCAVLRGKGLAVECCDFLAWRPAARFDRIVMNPPYGQGRARAHVERAAGLLADRGRLVAILPAGLRGRLDLPGCHVAWGPILERRFPGTSIDVSIAVVDRGAA